MSELYHHGIKGQKWGVRRYQNPDGTLTSAGKKRYSGDKIQVSSKTNKYSYKEGGYQFATEKEYYDWIEAGRPKREDRTVEYETTRHNYKSKGSQSGRKIVDELGKNEDYIKADKFDGIGMKAVQEYMDNGKDAVTKLLSNEMKNMEFDFAINDEKCMNDGSSYVTFSMKVYGNNKVYSTAGETDYSDDQYFYNRK